MNWHKVIIGILACLFILGCGPKQLEITIPPPLEGRVINSDNPAEVEVRASGVGKNLDEAELNARASAIAIVLLGGTDPLLNTQESRTRFNLIKEKFYVQSSVNQYVTFESPWSDIDHSQREKVQGGKKTKVTKHFFINKEMLRHEMERRGIRKSVEIVEELMNMPNIDVIPQAQENPIQLLHDQPELRHVEQVIGSYLSAKKYEYEEIEQKINMDEFVGAQQSLAGITEDDSHALALAAGGDIFIVYTLGIEEAVGKTGARGKQAIVGITAYESTTARGLGKETGYSEIRPGAADLSIIEEAVKNAIDNVLSRIDAHWRGDLRKGVQYRVVISIVGDFDRDEREDIGFAVSRIMKENLKHAKENIATPETLDYQVWVSPKEISDSRGIYGLLRDDFRTEFPKGVLRSVHLFKKMIILQVNDE